jgi:hypothetical protein
MPKLIQQRGVEDDVQCFRKNFHEQRSVSAEAGCRSTARHPIEHPLNCNYSTKHRHKPVFLFRHVLKQTSTYPGALYILLMRHNIL